MTESKERYQEMITVRDLQHMLESGVLLLRYRDQSMAVADDDVVELYRKLPPSLRDQYALIIARYETGVWRAYNQGKKDGELDLIRAIGRVMGWF